MDTRQPRFEGAAPGPRQTIRPRSHALSLRAASDKLGRAALAVERARRGTLARVRRSRLVRWRHRSPVADDLALSPPDLRLPDPSFVDEFDSGSVGLAGLTAQLGDLSPFALVGPSEAWARELHGFGWLRHFSSVRTLDNELLARRLVAEWIGGARRWPSLAWAPEVVACRMLSWLSHAGLILDGAERRPYGSFMLSLEDQATYLSAAWRNASDGYPRLLALIGLAQSALCIAGHESRLGKAERPLIEELKRQVLSDGAHVSRNPGTILDLLLDLLPLRQCFLARGLTPDETLTEAIVRMLSMLRHLRLGDGQLSRFNGMGATEREALATILTYDKAEQVLDASSLLSGYARLHLGPTVIVADVGAPPQPEFAGQACAGCLSFELSAGGEPVIVNAGAPASSQERFRAVSRSTLSHSTLSLNGHPSALLGYAEGFRQGAEPPVGRYEAVANLSEDDGAVALVASHDGYASRFGLVHARSIKLSHDGNCVEGCDKLEGAKTELRLAWDVPFAVHFHLHPRVGARLAGDGSIELLLPGGARWQFRAAGAAVSIEESTHYADLRGALHAQQVVLRGLCYGAAEVRWTLERVTDASLDLSVQFAEVRAIMSSEDDQDPANGMAMPTEASGSPR